MGKGYELRARRTWPLYPPTTRDALVELPIAFPEWFPASLDEWYSDEWVKRSKEECPVKEDCFIIGNHADEITVSPSHTCSARPSNILVKRS
jgi:tRNASer (uridine44-2'-O)-methyltransferase